MDMQSFCHASVFVLVDSNETPNPQRFIHVTVSCHLITDQTKYERFNITKISNETGEISS